MRKILLGAIGIACGLTGAPSFAQDWQVVEPPAAQAPAAPARVGLPPRGTSMAQVEAQFGAPTQRYAAVGQPPITRWVYPNFVVYFEYQHVVHAVAQHAAAPKP
jgi:hypothetical protein